MIFEDITLSWDGKEYKVKGDDKIMMLIAKVEDCITLQELTSGAPKMNKLAAGYATALQFAGAKATVAEVYASLFRGKGAGTSEAVQGLLAMMIPPQEMLENISEEETKKPEAETDGQ